MKRTKRPLSLLLALLMLVTMAPIAAPLVKQEALASPGDDTQSWDYNDETTMEQALSQALGYTSSGASYDSAAGMYTNLLGSNPSGYEWKGIGTWDDLVRVLKSTSASDKYISLIEDIKVEWTDDSKENEEIIITADKVLDLNGHAIRMVNKKNKEANGENACGGTVEKNGESSKTVGYRYTMFEIDGGTTVIMDSSKNQTGMIYNYAHNVNPFDHTITKWVSRDIFSVTNGNLVIFGGSYYAGRSKLLYESSDIWGTIKTFFGKAITLATKVTKYATGISEAEAGLKDVEANIEQAKKLAEERAKQNKTPAADDGNVNLKNEPTDDKKTDESKDNKKNNPTGNGDGTTGSAKEDTRDKTVGERQTDADNAKKDPPEKPKGKDDVTANSPEEQKKAGENNKSNDKGTAKEDDKKKNNNQQPQEPPKITDAQDVAKAKNAIANAAIGEAGAAQLTDIISDGLDLVDFVITECSRAKKCCTQYTLGTVVKVMNKGTFVAYGGKFYGHGSTEEQKDAVIEVVQKPKNTSEYARAYIYGGEYYGRGGANIFNIIRKNSSQTSKYFVKNEKTGGYEVRQRSLPFEETGGYEVLYLNDDNETFVDTSQIQVRNAKFRTNCDTLTTGLTIDGQKPTVLPGFQGSVNLGVESYNEKFIRDGRIQIINSFGDGSLVLLDDLKEKNNGENYHYRLFCSDAELRTLDNIDVMPNTMKDRTVNDSFHLTTIFNGLDISNYWPEDEENVRAPIARMDSYFDYPIDGDYHRSFSVTARFDDDDVYGEHVNTCECWYYPTPEPVYDALENLKFFEKEKFFYDGSKNDFIRSQKNFWGWESAKYWSNGLHKERGSAGYAWQQYNYFRNVKMFTYKIYKVDPLTMESISVKTGIPGKDEPVKTLKYATSNGTLRTRIELADLGIDYQRGEMYRITLEVEEAVNFAGNSTLVNRETAQKLESSCKASIVFRCVGDDELKESVDSLGHPILVGDYTPLQLGNDLVSGSVVETGTDLKCTFQARTGQVDLQARKIFDLYYQWYVKNPAGEDILIAGTDHVVDNPADVPAYRINNFILPGGKYPEGDGYQYKSTKPLPTKVNDNGTPYDESDDIITPDGWSCEDIHTYTMLDYDAKHGVWKDPNGRHTYSNNDIYGAGTDTLYIPEELAGCEIYCKAIAINNWWPINYDRRQTFYSHVIRVAGGADVTLAAEYASGTNAATISKPATVKVASVNALVQGEKITAVTYTMEDKTKEFTGLSAASVAALPTVKFPTDFNAYSLDKGSHAIVCTVQTDQGNTYRSSEYFRVNYEYGDLKPVVICEYSPGKNTATAASPATFHVEAREIQGLAANEKITEVTYQTLTHSKTFTNLNAVSVDEIPSVRFPTDFTNAGRTGDRTMQCRLTTSLGRQITATVAPFTFDILATSAELYIRGQTYSIVDDGIRTYIVNELFEADRCRVRILPSDASVNNLLITNGNLFSTNPEVAYFDEDGVFHLGDACGETVISVIGPDGATQKVRIFKPVSVIEFLDLDAPTPGEPLDYEISVPVDAPYRISKVVWYKVPYDTSFAENYKCEEGDIAQPFTWYSVRIEVQSMTDYPVVYSDMSVNFFMEYTDAYGNEITYNREVNGFGHAPTDNVIRFGYNFDMVEDPERVVNSLSLATPLTVMPWTSAEDFLNSVELVGISPDCVNTEMSVRLSRTGLAQDGNQFVPGQEYYLYLRVKPGDTGCGYRLGEPFELYVNDSLVAKREKKDANSAYEFSIPITVGTDPSPAPKLPVAMESTECYVKPGDTFNLTDYYALVGDCDFDIEYEYDSENYWPIEKVCTLDAATGTVAVKNVDTDEVFRFTVKIYAVTDHDNDGNNEVRILLGSILVNLKASLPAPAMSTVTVLDYAPNGTLLNTRTLSVPTNRWFTMYIEPVDNAFVKDFTLTDVLKASTVFNKKENAYKFKPIAERGTVKVIRDQVAPNSLTLVSEPEYFSFKIPGIDSETLFFSLDGKVYDTLSIENYNEDAAVYFKQGVDGKVYSKVLKMPGRYYDIYVGDTQLSDDNMAQFAAKGLSYDYLTDTLTLNNYIGEMEACYKGSAPYAVIYSKSDLTVCVLGASRITNTTEHVTYKNAAAALKADGNIRFTGSGTLTLKNSCEAFREQYGVYCTGAAVLDMNGGKLNIVLNPNQDIVADKAYGIFGELQCLNGTLEVNSLYVDERYPQKIVEPVSGDIDVNSASSYTLKLGQTASSRTAFTGGINAVANADTGYRSMLLICSHTHSYDVKEKSKTFIAVPATCTTENVYYMSCVCGCYTTEQTFGGEGRDAHRWQEVKGRAPTYDAPGYTDYLVCTVCGIARNYQELPQLERPVAPPVPTGLAAASNAPGAITVTWDAAEHATRYDVYSMIGGDYVKIGSTAETSYTHTGLTPGETYYYKVVAVNESELGELASAMSAAVSAKPAAEPPATHSITVANGTASVSSAAKGTTVTITASVPESKEFDRWEVVKGDITLADASKATTTFVMGDLDVEVKAVFKDIFHTVTVTDGTASVSSATKGTTVTITAAAAPEGKAFDKWEVVKGGITLADVTANVTTFVMGDLDVEVKVSYKDLPPAQHSVTVTNGTTSVNAAAKGTTVTITASAAPEGKAFDKWEVVKGNITLADVTSTVTTFVMGDLNVEVKAVYMDIGSSGEERLFGDIDGDGNITAADARLALRMSVDIMHDDGIPFTDKQITAADVDRDGRVTGADARLLLRKAVGLEVLSEGWAGPV
ncbi:MAG: hypothetical protein IK108_05905 [Clostridia bacterium]|nr:hypothetical protein [Clostridia bacterium]